MSRSGTAKKNIANGRVLHVCNQTDRLTKIETSISKVSEETKEHMAALQTGFGKALEQTDRSISDLSKMVKDAFFPSEIHPNNGMINQIKNLSNSYDSLNSKFEIMQQDKVASSNLQKEKDRLRNWIWAIIVLSTSTISVFMTILLT